MTPESWSKLALELPEVVQKSHFGQPDFRVRGKIFAGLSRDGGWTHVTLAAASVREVRPLLLQAWQLIAPKSLRDAR